MGLLDSLFTGKYSVDNNADSPATMGWPSEPTSRPWSELLGVQGGLGSGGVNGYEKSSYQPAQLMSGYLGDTGAVQPSSQDKFLSKGYKDVSQYGQLDTLLGYLRSMPGGQQQAYTGLNPNIYNYLEHLRGA